MDVRRFLRGPIFWIAMAVIAVLVGSSLISGIGAPDEVDTGEAISDITSGNVDTATLIDRDQVLELTLRNGDEVRSHFITGQGVELQNLLQEKTDAGQLPGGYNVVVPSENLLVTLFISLLPFALLILLMVFIFSQMQGGGGRLMNFGKSKAKAITKDMPQTTFEDVAGSDEAVEELVEIKDFLSDAERFQKVGAKIPKGVLLYGPPGTGKTLLARAVAGEAGAPFYSISGSDFVEMFVGVGASRVRDLFEQAKANAPAIIFIDEIDAVGRHRGAGLGGGHDEREQTLNQMLVEMDGFDVTGGVILIAATNRPDILDPALLRPGRFDRQIAVERPDLNGRYEILKVHAKGKPITDDIDLMAVARRTPGFTGADLANVLNEAALLTARSDKTFIDDEALDEAIDRVIAGPQKRTRVMDEHEKTITAYHEAGHALVAAALPGNDPVHKITIMPRGRALGYTMVLPDQDKYSTTRSEMLNQLAYMLGGRAAEELIFHDPTTGAANDIEKATSVARSMVTQFGMTERLGAIKYGQEQSEVFLGRDMGHMRDYSEEVAAAIDEEVRGFIEAAHQEAYDVLVNNREILDAMVLALLERETLDKAEIEEIFAELKLQSPRPAWTGSARRAPDTRGPIPFPPASSNGHSSSSAIEPALNESRDPDAQ
ncbi:MAG: ATP-dependent zinc metalloprotease FtsH [Actinomycetota bacterium]|nr:cell division protein FtsH [Micrococcales bacterium]MEC7590709.1 ATP-dependent zinc metalloprotease FtsH [Actinomycetota bacterium]MEC8445501.1 ATP-dependent zinc metalloprotease FtsH [Actinomycetota bacterium]MEC8648045.1 ATP-dependent zinc metalloprotease FtsH [Actinomycetota bacterium]MED6331094.1 ATP-dependent zinc metalloprotease FtsH [Actinomycetota bacterium]